jgi:N-acetylglucosamine malate deacetylase 1
MAKAKKPAQVGAPIVGGFMAKATAGIMADFSADFMAIGAHADDIEINAGGTIAKLLSQGRTGVLVDLTDASAGTRGTPELRLREAEAAAQSLAKTAARLAPKSPAKMAARVPNLIRINLGLPDGHLTDSVEAQALLIAAIRRFRPRILITHGEQEDHPDHGAACRLVQGAAFKSGLQKLVIAGAGTGAGVLGALTRSTEPAYRPQRLFHWLGMEPPQPSFAVDITMTWQAKLAAIRCYASQFHVPQAARSNAQGARKHGAKTDLATPAFLEAVEYRARYFGARIKRRYAEAFYCHELPEIEDMTALGGSRFP